MQRIGGAHTTHTLGRTVSVVCSPLPPLINFLFRKHILRVRVSTEVVLMENHHETTACYPAPENTLPSLRKHETHEQKPFCQAPESMLPYITEETLSYFFWTASTHGTVGVARHLKIFYRTSENNAPSLCHTSIKQ